jgi:hypothetical protein
MVNIPVFPIELLRTSIVFVVLVGTNPIYEHLKHTGPCHTTIMQAVLRLLLAGVNF